MTESPEVSPCPWIGEPLGDYAPPYYRHSIRWGVAAAESSRSSDVKEAPTAMVGASSPCLRSRVS